MRRIVSTPKCWAATAANVIFTTIYGKPYQTACTLGFPAEQAEYIQRVAQQTVLENLTLLNIKGNRICTIHARVRKRGFFRF